MRVSYKYIALITNRVVFALAMGQGSVCFRVPAPFRETALATGAVAQPEIGRDWVRFELYRNDRPKPDIPFWTLRAYVAARESDT
jgi:hypothetical protein